MKGVVVATGLGQYLLPMTIHFARPSTFKPERPWIDYAIEAFVSAGFEELGIVLGYNEDILRSYLQGSSRYGIAIYCLHNPWYLRGSATFLYAVRPFVEGEAFVVALADRLLSPHILFPLLTRPWQTHVMCVHRRRRASASTHDIMRVSLDRYGRVQSIGKRLKHWHAVDAGVFLFQPRIFHHSSHFLRHQERPCSLIQLARHLIAHGDELWSYDVSDSSSCAYADYRNHFRYAPQVLSIRLAQEELVA